MNRKRICTLFISLAFLLLALLLAQLLSAGGSTVQAQAAPTTQQGAPVHFVVTDNTGGSDAGAKAALPSDTVRFVVTGDSRGNSVPNSVNTLILSEIVTATMNEDADFILFPGDLVWGGSSDNLVSREVLASQLITWRNTVQPLYDSGIEVYPCRGNHEIYSTDSKGAWDDVFTGTYALPDNGPSGEENITFSFTRGNVFVVGLDQYVDPNRVNQTWLNEQFASNTQPHVFVFGHEPAFKVRNSSNLAVYPSDRNTFWNSIAAEGGRTYFAGHDHFYDHARLEDGDVHPDDDLHQFIVGTAGATLYDDEPYDGDNGCWTPQGLYHEKQYGYVLVEIDGLNATLTWKHRTAPGVYEATGEVFTYTVIPEPTKEWTAYIDLNAYTGSNHPNVLEFVPNCVGSGCTPPFLDSSTGVLKNFDTGADLPVTMSVTMDIQYPTANGADSDPGTDADLLFGGIVDGTGGYEIVTPGDYLTVTFGNLNPNKDYVVALSHNRDRDTYTDRATRYTISGADTYTNVSSACVVEHSEDSVSFCTGDNADGYVAKWTGVTAADGNFSVTTVQDKSRPEWQGSKAYALTSIVLQEVSPTFGPHENRVYLPLIYKE